MDIYFIVNVRFGDGWNPALVGKVGAGLKNNFRKKLCPAPTMNYKDEMAALLEFVLKESKNGSP